MQAMFSNVEENETFVQGLTTIKNFDEYTLNHSVNVCLLALSLGKRLGLDRNELVDLAIGAFFHDYGKLDVPKEILLKPGKLDEGERFLLQAKEVNPQLRELHFNLALLHEERQELSQAADEYRLELEINPYSFRASFNLSRIYRFLKDDREEEKYLNKTMEINPNFPLSYFYLARVYLNRGTMYPEAISLTEKGIALNPPKVDLPLGYFLLADLYNRLGEQAKSQENLEKGKALVAENQKKED